MDLSAFAGLLSPVSSILGGLLLGPAGAALLPQIVVPMAKALGVDPTPEAVAEKASADPEAFKAAARKVEDDHGEALAASEQAILQIVNETARLELQQESRFVKWARPANIWVIAGGTAGYTVCILAATVQYLWTRDSAALALLLRHAIDVSLALTPCGAVAGITSWGRTKEKVAGLPSGADGLLAGAGAVVGAVVKGRRRG